MNAPATAAAVAPATPPAAGRFAEIPLADIGPSTTHIQALRRQRFDAAALGELAASITALGVAQPIVVTPYKLAPGLNPTGKEPKFVIVAGERRWLAAKLAKIATVPASIRELTPEQILEIQLVENLQREGLHEMEEAEGYSELMKLKGLNADQVGEKISKSRAYVFARLKLLDLCPEARKAFYAGEVQASVALLVARVPHHDTQRALLKEVINGEYDNGEPMTYREAVEHIAHKYQIDLKGAVFNIKDAFLLVGRGDCGACPKRSGNQKDLFTDIKNPNVCTDTKCYADKVAAHNAAKLASLKAAGTNIITGAAAKKIKPNEYGRGLNGYVDLDTQEYFNGKLRTLRAAMGKHIAADAIAVLECPHTQRLVEIATPAVIAKARKAAGYKDRTSSNGPTAADKAAQTKQRIEIASRFALLRAIRKANQVRPLTHADTLLVAGWMWGSLGFDRQKRLVDDLMAEHGVAKPQGHDYVRDHGDNLNSLNGTQLAAFMLDMALVGACHQYGDDEDLIATAERLKIDHKAIYASVKADMAATKK